MVGPVKSSEPLSSPFDMRVAASGQPGSSATPAPGAPAAQHETGSRSNTSCESSLAPASTAVVTTMPMDSSKMVPEHAHIQRVEEVHGWLSLRSLCMLVHQTFLRHHCCDTTEPPAVPDSRVCTAYAGTTRNSSDAHAPAPPPEAANLPPAALSGFGTLPSSLPIFGSTEMEQYTDMQRRLHDEASPTPTPGCWSTCMRCSRNWQAAQVMDELIVLVRCALMHQQADGVCCAAA